MVNGIGRLARKIRRKKKKAIQHHEKMNTSISQLNESQASQNGLPDLAKSKKFVQVNHMSRVLNLNTFEPIDCVYEEATGDSSQSSIQPGRQANKPPELPKINIETMLDYPECTDRFRLPPNYIKFVEKTNEEMDEEVEYDMDEEDTLWLRLINEQRLQADPNYHEITQEDFEILMDRLEKESYFQTVSNKTPDKNNTINELLNASKNNNDSSSEDALCCICLDGECLNSNVILFCDMCNLAVHQECYGVPYIPEGQWLCRRCIQSPSAPVNCILCPNRYGAFKQTDRGLWTHVVCAIWIPEVHFANTVFLEPVIGIENIDRARWKLMCYICRKRNVGACIQCDKFNCYTAFHVTCAQQAGLYMNIREEEVENEAVRRKKNGKRDQRFRNNSSSSSQTSEVKRCAYCDIHTPLEVLSPRTRKSIGAAQSAADCEEAMKEAQKQRMRKARKILAERRDAPPQVCMPVIHAEKIQGIMDRVDFENKEVFFKKIMNYWLLKRYSRNGVPILRRLQSIGLKKTNELKKLDQNENVEERLKAEELNEDEKAKIYEELKEQHGYWKRLRQDLERARILMELIRKRERLKRECIRIAHLKAIYEINPLNGIFLQQLLDSLREFDKNRIFFEPVDAKEVPGYYETIKQPMDFSTMQHKLNNMQYECLSQFEADYNLIITNCLQFNQKNSFFYKLAFKMREQTSSLMKQAKRVYLQNNQAAETHEKNVDAAPNLSTLTI